MHDKGCLSVHEFLRFIERKRIKRLFLSEKKIKLYPHLETPFSSFFSTTMYIYSNLCQQDKKFNAYLCSYIHRQNSHDHMYTSRIPLYCYKLRLNDRGCLSIHRYLICTKTKEKNCFLL